MSDTEEKLSNPNMCQCMVSSTGIIVDALTGKPGQCHYCVKNALYDCPLCTEYKFGKELKLLAPVKCDGCKCKVVLVRTKKGNKLLGESELRYVLASQVTRVRTVLNSLHDITPGYTHCVVDTEVMTVGRIVSDWERRMTKMLFDLGEIK